MSWLPAASVRLLLVDETPLAITKSRGTADCSASMCRAAVRLVRIRAVLAGRRKIAGNESKKTASLCAAAAPTMNARNFGPTPTTTSALLR